MLQPMLKEYEEYNPKVDQVNELGNMFDAIQRGEPVTSPVRRSEYLTAGPQQSLPLYMYSPSFFLIEERSFADN